MQYSLESLMNKVKELKESFIFNSSQIIISHEKGQMIIISCLCWFFVYCIFHFFWEINLKTRKEIDDTKNRIMSVLHSLIGLGLCFYDFISFQWDEFCSASTIFQNYFICFTIGYFIYDLICCILLDIYDKELILHHLFCIVCFYFQLAVDFSGMATIRFFILNELSIPIMHIRVILRTYGLKLTKLYICLELVYIIIYIITRGIFVPILIYYAVLFCPNKTIISQGCIILVFLLSLINIKKMFAILKLRYREMCERKIKNIKFFWFEVNKKAREFYCNKNESSKLNHNKY